MGFCALGLGFMKKNNRKMGMGFQFEQHRLGLWDLSWEMGLGPPIHDPPDKITSVSMNVSSCYFPFFSCHWFFSHLEVL